MTPPSESGAPPQSPASSTFTNRQHEAGGVYCTASQQVNWLPVHEWVAPKLAQAGSWPMAGSPAWCLLDDRDPAKWAALLDAAQHHALRVEMAQVAACEAARDVSAAVDWSTVAGEIRSRTEFYNSRPWLRRVAS